MIIISSNYDWILNYIRNITFSKNSKINSQIVLLNISIFFIVISSKSNFFINRPNNRCPILTAIGICQSHLWLVVHSSWSTNVLVIMYLIREWWPIYEIVQDTPNGPPLFLSNQLCTTPTRRVSTVSTIMHTACHTIHNYSQTISNSRWCQPVSLTHIQ